MKLNTLKCLTAALACSISAQTYAQIGSPARTPQSETNTFTDSLDVTKTLLNSKKPWQSSEYYNTDRQTGIKSLFALAKKQIDNPSLQKKGGLDGGGGNAEICDKGSEITIQLLDLAEAGKLDIDMGPGNYEQKLEYVFKRLARIVPTYAAYLSSMAQDLMTKDTEWPDNSTLRTIDDTEVLSMKKNCLHVQVAVQRPISQRNVPNALPYFINKDIFALLDDDSKAALILHEVVYRVARFSEQSDSVFARKLTALIASRQISQYNKKTFNSMLAKNNVRCLEDNKLPLLFSKGFPNQQACSFINYTDIQMNISRSSIVPATSKMEFPWQAFNLSKLQGRLDLIALHSTGFSEQTPESLDDEEVAKLIKWQLPEYEAAKIKGSGFNTESDPLFKIKGKASFYPFWSNTPAHMENGYVLRALDVNETSKDMTETTYVFGNVKFNSERVSYVSTQISNVGLFVTAFTHLIRFQNKISVHAWQITANAMKDSVGQYSLKVLLPKTSPLAKNTDGWVSASSVTVTPDNKLILEIRYRIQGGKEVVVTDLKLLN